MSYYTGCELKINFPPHRSTEEDAICQALLTKLPGVSVQVISTPDARRLSVAEAFVPKNHSMAGMTRQDLRRSEVTPVAGETLFGIASDVLDEFRE